jgi:excisionase family DNA binding protein
MNEPTRPVSLDDFGDLLTEEETSQVLRVSRMTLYRMRRDGRIRAVKIRGAIRYRKADLLRLLSGDESGG